uniref:DUF1421 domain containing protein n=1 Tax=Panagrellus redivivus TaxID=6233 RepID=A0A7E4UWQ3_PANRE
MAESPPSDYMDVDGAGGDASFPVNGETPTNGYAFDAMDGPSPVKKAKYDPDVINQKIPMILVNGQSHTTVDNNGVPLDVLVHHVPQNADLQNLHPIKISSVVHGGFSEGSEDEQSSTVTSSEDVHQPKAEEPVASVAAAAETNGQPAELVEEQGPTAVHAVTSNISTITISSDEGMLPPAKTAPKPIQPTVGFGYHSDEPSSDESVAQKAPEPVPSYAEIIGDLIPTCSSHILPIRRIGKRIIVEPWWKPYKGYTIDGRFCHFFNGFAVPPCDVPGPPNDSFRVHESMSVAKTGANYCIDDYETLDGCDKKVQTGITVYMEHDFDLDEEFPELKLDEKTVVSLPTHPVCFEDYVPGLFPRSLKSSTETSYSNLKSLYLLATRWPNPKRSTGSKIR